MSDEVEQFLQKSIFPEMEHGRPNWDVPHTKAVVRYVKEIINANPQLHLDESVLIIAAYAHDWGYAGLFVEGKPANFAEVHDQKTRHMLLGSQKIAKLLQDPTFNFLSLGQKQRIEHLVGVHDRLDQLVDADELVLMEADTLGMCDSEATTPSYNAHDDVLFRDQTESRRVTLFITDYSKTKVKELLKKREQYFQDLAKH